MKLVSNIKEVIILDEDPIVGCLVKSAIDENATGMIVEFLSKDEIMVLWSTPPKRILKNREIW
jgi:hypothetical protein